MTTAEYFNWARNVSFSSARFHQPTTVTHVQDIIRHAHKVRPIGSRHSFNRIADCAEDMLSLEHLNRVLSLDRPKRTVTVEGGMVYGPLCVALQREGWALANLASLPHITVAGACATATHGSGDRNGNLASAVAALQFVAADGELHTLSRAHDGDRFCGAVVALGALGVVTQLTLDLVPAFDMRQDVYSQLPLANLNTHFDAISSSAYSVSLFWDWRSDTINQVWLKHRLADGGLSDPRPDFYGATRAHIGGPADLAYAERMGCIGPWYERLPHFRMQDFPGDVDQLQAEYFVPRQHFCAALDALKSLSARIAPLLYITEIRTVAADDLWLSPCYQQDCVAIHFTWKNDWPSVSGLLTEIEARLAPYTARPHWGKLFNLPAQHLRALYPRLPDFQTLQRTYDPLGKFRNAFIETYL